jgi:hypothetical protein
MDTGKCKPLARVDELRQAILRLGLERQAVAAVPRKIDPEGVRGRTWIAGWQAAMEQVAQEVVRFTLLPTPALRAQAQAQEAPVVLPQGVVLVQQVDVETLLEGLRNEWQPGPMRDAMDGLRRSLLAGGGS